MKNPMLWLAGADKTILARCPTERTKIQCIGGAVLTTATLAAIAASFTANRMLHVPVAPAILVGLLWGAAIMNLDRWLLVSMRRQRSVWMTVAMAIPRLALALVVGLVVAEPLVLQVFENEVTAQAVRDRQESKAAARAQLARQYARIPRLERQQAAFERGLTSVDRGAAFVTSPQYKMLDGRLSALQGKLARAQRTALCEFDGTCGTKREGSGPVYAARQQLVRRLQSRVDDTQSQLASLQNRLLHDESSKKALSDRFARGDLARVRSELRSLRARRDRDQRALIAAYNAPIGLLDRVDALSALTRASASMRDVRLLLQIFIVLLDALPVVIKLLMLVGRPPLYERLQDDAEDRRFDTAVLQQEMLEEARRIDLGIVVEEAKLRRDLRRDALRELIASAVAAETRAAAARIPGPRTPVDPAQAVAVHRNGSVPE